MTWRPAIGRGLCDDIGKGEPAVSDKRPVRQASSRFCDALTASRWAHGFLNDGLALGYLYRSRQPRPGSNLGMPDEPERRQTP